MPSLIDDGHRLRDLRWASQTCSAWRDTLLHSPSIWAKCLIFDELESTSEEWKSEVVRRTGNAPLHVIRLLEFRRRFDADDEWFYHFLRENWHRIHTLNITISVVSLEKYLELQKLPAPHLVLCRCTFRLDKANPDRTYLQNPDPVVAFGGGAPCLRKLMLNSSSFHPNSLRLIPTPCLFQLRSLEINPLHDEVKLLEALSAASLLETLTLHFKTPTHGDDSASSADTDAVPHTTASAKLFPLLSLKELDIRVVKDVAASIRFLSQLDMRKCKFKLRYHAYTEPFLYFPEMSSLAAVLAAYFHHFEGGPETIERRPLTFDADRNCVGMYGGPKELSIILHTCDGSGIPDMTPLLQALADSRWYETTKELRLGISRKSHYLPLRILLASLRSVTRLIIDATNFARICDWRQLRTGKKLLPALEEILVTDVVEKNKNEVLRQLKEFSNSRVSCRAKPIKFGYALRIEGI
ncbi:hypothetical protein CPC08DRAFT_771495 [Agrocybe pediades]|nr:hypothetical protein CPC08DRAFT_771495 [Agrocybe pediades]